MVIAELSGFQPILLYIAVLTGFVITNLILAHVIGPWKRTAVKQMPYESGMDPIHDTRRRFDIGFYLVAIVFLVFDVELLFLYPWAVTVFDLGWAAWISMMVFIAELALGLAYAWKVGALEWE